MTMSSPTSHPPLPVDHARRRSTPLALVVGAATIALVTVLSAGASGAQTGTSLGPPVTLPAENPGSTAAGVVFFVTTGAIVVGALILYLRHRQPRVPADR
jgi:hypothetical protein